MHRGEINTIIILEHINRRKMKVVAIFQIIKTSQADFSESLVSGEPMFFFGSLGFNKGIIIVQTFFCLDFEGEENDFNSRNF